MKETDKLKAKARYLLNKLASGEVLEAKHFLKNLANCEIELEADILSVWLGNSLGIQIRISDKNYRVFDPFNQLNNTYKQANGWTYWNYE